MPISVVQTKGRSVTAPHYKNSLKNNHIALFSRAAGRYKFLACHNRSVVMLYNPRTRLVTNYLNRLAEANGDAVLAASPYLSAAYLFWLICSMLGKSTDRVTGVQVEPVMDNSEKLTACDSRGILYPQRQVTQRETVRVNYSQRPVKFYLNELFSRITQMNYLVELFSYFEHLVAAVELTFVKQYQVKEQ